MANCINRDIQIKLDGQYIHFKSVEYRIAESSATITPYHLDIKLILSNDFVIYDNGSRVEIIYVNN